MTQEQFPHDDAPQTDPTMELLEGDATAAPTAGPSGMMKLARGATYGVVLLAATALLAVSAVPELANYASFGKAKAGSSCSATTGSACTTLDNVQFDLPCCASKTSAAMASTSGSSSCCPLSSADATETVLATTEDGTKSCCSSISRASLLAKSAGTSPCCESAAGCETKGAVVEAEQPIDAGSLLAAATSEDAAEDQSDEQRTELKPDDNEVKE